MGEEFRLTASDAFNCDHRATFDDDAAALARQRTLDLFAAHLGSRH